MIHAALDRAGAPGHGQAVGDGVEVLFQALGERGLSLTWEQIDYFVARERVNDALFDKQEWHDAVLFDRAIHDDRHWRNGRLCDRPMTAEPEIDDPEIG